MGQFQNKFVSDVEMDHVKNQEQNVRNTHEADTAMYSSHNHATTGMLINYKMIQKGIFKTKLLAKT